LLERADFRNNEHYVGGVKGTREALKWVFEAKEGDVSPLYECGNNDHMMVVAVEKINPAGYRDINSVVDMLSMEIRREKKAEKILAELNGVTSIEQVKGMANAVSDTIKHITFGAPTFVGVTRASEPTLGAVASKNEVNKVSDPVKGNTAVYVMQVINKENNAEEFNAKNEENSLSMMATRYASSFINDLYEKAKVKDNRYLYF
jgi:peptidyl-prolyl cis-trans isomerase D